MKLPYEINMKTVCNVMSWIENNKTRLLHLLQCNSKLGRQHKRAPVAAAISSFISLLYPTHKPHQPGNLPFFNRSVRSFTLPSIRLMKEG